jgi:hypothetical protein
VLIAEPGEILADSPRGLNDLYVALTRATQRVGVVHTGDVPGVLARLSPIASTDEITSTDEVSSTGEITAADQAS